MLGLHTKHRRYQQTYCGKNRTFFRKNSTTKLLDCDDCEYYFSDLQGFLLQNK